MTQKELTKMKNYELITGFADEISQDFNTQVESFKKLGIKYIEMRGVDGKNLIHHDDAKVKEIKKRLDDQGMALSALGSPLGKIGIDDPFELHFEEFKRAVEIAHMMNAPYIRMFSFYVPNDKNSCDAAAIKDKVFERLGKFSDYAKNNEICLLHENEKGIYGEKARECKEILEAFSGKHFKAILDFANFVQSGQDTLEAYELLKDYIEYIHVKDALFVTGKVVPAGFGQGNVKEILDKLFASGFKGFLSLEPHLFDFEGFAGLEKGNSKLPNLEIGKKLTSFESFKLAHDSLLNLL